MTAQLIKARSKRCLEVARSIRDAISRKKMRYIVREVEFGGVILYSTAPDSEPAITGWFHSNKKHAEFLATILNLLQGKHILAMAEELTGVKQNV